MALWPEGLGIRKTRRNASTTKHRVFFLHLFPLGMANDLVSVLSDIKHRFPLEIWFAVVMPENETTRDVFYSQVVDHERLANVCEMRDVIFVGDDKKVLHSDVQVDDFGVVMP